MALPLTAKEQIAHIIFLNVSAIVTTKDFHEPFLSCFGPYSIVMDKPECF
jgi:hypothetical protein